MPNESNNNDKADPNRDRDEALGVSRQKKSGERLPEAPTGAINADEGAEARAKEAAIEIARSLHDDKCDDVMILDVRQRSQVTDYLVIATGTSSTQMRSAAHNAAKLAKKDGFSPLTDNLGDRDQNWIVIDLVDLVIHVFDANSRVYYDLEMLWGDAPRLAWARPGDDVHAGGTGSRNRAGLNPGEAHPDG